MIQLTDTELAVLLSKAEDQLRPGQQTFDFGDIEQIPVKTSDVADWRDPETIKRTLVNQSRSISAIGKVITSPATILWEILQATYDRLGFTVVADDAFKAMVLARIIEPTSKADTIRVLTDIGAPHPSLRTLFRSLGTCIDKDYRDQLAKAVVAYRSATAGLASLVMYDVTTLHFEAKDEDQLRKVGMSKDSPC